MWASVKCIYSLTKSNPFLSLLHKASVKLQAGQWYRQRSGPHGVQARSLLWVCKPFSLPFSRLALMKRTKSFSSSCYEQCNKYPPTHRGAAHPRKNGLCWSMTWTKKQACGFALSSRWCLWIPVFCPVRMCSVQPWKLKKSWVAVGRRASTPREQWLPASSLKGMTMCRLFVQKQSD